jgi:hypothetical protein
VSIAEDVSSLTTDKLRRIAGVAYETKILALNAQIEAARAADHGRGFTVVAENIGRVSEQVRALSEDLSGQLAPKIAELDKLGRELVEQVRGQRLADQARTAIELIDRNLYERSCDVRWWATDTSVYEACQSPGDRERTDFACHRLGVILASYTVYLDLWIADASGRVVAHGRPERYRDVLGSDVSDQEWFQSAMQTRDGEEFAVADIQRVTQLDNSPTAIYSTAVRERGETRGRAVGALGIFFDWGPQAQGIVEDIGLTEEERERTRCLLLDRDGRIIAASDREGILTERVHLRTDSRKQGYYTDASGSVVGFCLTPGYETYEGLGWYGAILQRPPAR